MEIFKSGGGIIMTLHGSDNSYFPNHCCFATILGAEHSIKTSYIAVSMK